MGVSGSPEGGGLVLIDRRLRETVAVGLIRGPIRTTADLPIAVDRDTRPVSPDVVWEEWNISLAEREARNGHLAAVLWFTGLSASGKTTLGRALEHRLFDRGVSTMLLDGDQVRHGLSGDLGFDPDDRRENIRRVGEAASLFLRQGCVVLCTFISPFRRDRRRARELVPEGRFLEVFVDTPLDECERRDPKGLYARARRGEIVHMTGVSSPYEVPERPELRVETQSRSVEEIVDQIFDEMLGRGMVPAD